VTKTRASFYSQWYITDEDDALGLTLNNSLTAGTDLVLSGDFVGGPPWFYWTLETANGAAAVPALNAAAAHAALPAPVMTG
jgi:hypothetical protein